MPPSAKEVLDSFRDRQIDHQGNVREFKDNRGRWLVSDFAIRFVDNEYRLVSGDVSLEAQILGHVASNPGCSQNSVRQAVSGAGVERIRSELQRLIREGKIEDEGDIGTTCVPAT